MTNRPSLNLSGRGSRLVGCTGRIGRIGNIALIGRLGCGGSGIGRFLIGLFCHGLRCRCCILGGAHRRQQAMDESGRIVIAQGLGQCQSLVDGDLVRHIIGEQNLPSGDTQNVAIDHAHTADLPTRGVFVQGHVDLTTVLGHALDDFNGIVGKRGLGTGMCDALVKQGENILAFFVGFVQGVQSLLRAVERAILLLS